MVEVRPMDPYIFRISVTRGTSQASLYDHTPFCIQKKANNGTSVRKKNRARSIIPYIFRVSITRGTLSAYLYGHTPFCIQPGKKDGAINLKLGMQTQLDSLNNMGWVPSGHTFSSLFVRQKNAKNGTLIKQFDLITYSL